jgi:hypothetical protein
VPCEVEEQAVLRFAPVPADETREGLIKGHIVLRILHHLHVEAMRLQCGSDRFNVFSDPWKFWPSICVVAHPDHERVALFIESDRLAHLRLDLDALDATGFGGKSRKSEQQDGKCKQELAVDMSQRAGIGKRYAAGVFHNWSKEAREPVLPRFVLQRFSLKVGLHEGLRLRAVPGVGFVTPLRYCYA